MPGLYLHRHEGQVITIGDDVEVKVIQIFKVDNKNVVRLKIIAPENMSVVPSAEYIDCYEDDAINMTDEVGNVIEVKVINFYKIHKKVGASLQIVAPKNIKVWRKELYARICEEKLKEVNDVYFEQSHADRKLG